MSEALFEILRGFRLDAEPVSCEPYGCGHINTTYLAVTASGRRYILQKINHHTFRDVAGLMENITSVTEFLRTKTDDPAQRPDTGQNGGRRKLFARAGGLLARV